MVVALLVPVACVVLNVVAVLNTVVIAVLFDVSKVVVVLNAVVLTPDIVLCVVSVSLVVVCTTLKGPSREPPSFTNTWLTLLSVPSSLTARKEI